MGFGFQGTGLGCQSCGCNPCSCYPTNCTNICTSLFVQNAWNVPAVNANATLAVPFIKSILPGQYLWNPTYGYFLVISFNPVTGQVVVTNQGTAGNATPGTLVPASTAFAVVAPPISNVIDWSSAITSLTATGAMTISALVVNYAKYSLIGPKLVWYSLAATFTTGGTASTGVIHPLPVTAALGAGAGIAATCVDSTQVGGSAVFTDTTHGRVSKADNSNWGLGASRQIITGGIYEAA